jgi:hypothetical protein
LDRLFAGFGWHFVWIGVRYSTQLIAFFLLLSITYYLWIICNSEVWFGNTGENSFYLTLLKYNLHRHINLYKIHAIVITIIIIVDVFVSSYVLFLHSRNIFLPFGIVVGF